MTDAITVIQREHRALFAVIHCLEHLVAEIRKRDVEPDFELFGVIVDYIASFLDQFHHPKEDAYLFKILYDRAPESRPALDDLREQHSEGYRLTATLAHTLADYKADGAAGFARFADAVAAYTVFQRAHVKKEEQEILPAARSHFTEHDWEIVDAAFNDNEDPLFGAEPKTRFRRQFSKIVNMAPPPLGLGRSAAP